jgi:3-deoxy-manno-octulosonate cytidylyltransferase (CMP-KDO synthetase)
MSKVIAIIPARWASTRFPGKPLVPLLGKALVQHVWERCCEAEGLDGVVIATDDMRIAEAAFAFGAEVSVTKSSHPTGTDRLGEVAERLRGVTHLLNVQGDEPAIDPELISRLATTMRLDPKVDMVTAAAPFPKGADLNDPNKVKVVVNLAGDALYFSRAPIPVCRDGKGATLAMHHMGIYGYRRKFLQEFIRWKPTPLELSESLEQLRALEHGVRIRVIPALRRSIGVDCPTDVPDAERELKRLLRRRAGR